MHRPYFAGTWVASTLQWKHYYSVNNGVGDMAIQVSIQVPALSSFGCVPRRDVYNLICSTLCFPNASSDGRTWLPGAALCSARLSNPSASSVLGQSRRPTGSGAPECVPGSGWINTCRVYETRERQTGSPFGWSPARSRQAPARLDGRRLPSLGRRALPSTCLQPKARQGRRSQTGLLIFTR